MSIRWMYWFFVAAVYGLAAFLAVTDHKTAAFAAVVTSLAALLFGLYRLTEWNK